VHWRNFYENACYSDSAYYRYLGDLLALANKNDPICVSSPKVAKEIQAGMFVVRYC
jgi:hypothetical protein